LKNPFFEKIRGKRNCNGKKAQFATTVGSLFTVAEPSSSPRYNLSMASFDLLLLQMRSIGTTLFLGCF